MKTMFYTIDDPDNEFCVADCNAEKFVLDFMTGSEQETVTSSELVVMYFRIYKKEHPEEEMELMFAGDDDTFCSRNVELREDGRCGHWYEGFCDAEDKALRRLHK